MEPIILLMLMDNQLPLMLVGQILCTIGTGLLITIGSTTSTASWIAIMVTAGFGDGLCTNMPYTAIQGIIQNEDDVFVGNAIATFATLAGGAIAISIGENLLISKLLAEVPKRTSTISAEEVVEAGALGLQRLSISSSVLYDLRQSYSVAIAATMIYATVAIAISILASFGMKWLNLKTISKEIACAETQCKSVRSGDEEVQPQVAESVTSKETFCS